MAHPTFSAPSAAPTLTDICSLIQPAVNGSEAPTTSSVTADLDGKADDEDAELRHHARDDAERDVGDQQRDQHRRRDLQRRREDAREDVHGAADQRAQLRGGGRAGRVRRCAACRAGSRPTPPITRKISGPDERVEALDDGAASPFIGLIRFP